MTTDDLITRYWRSWQDQDWTVMRECLADSVRITDGRSQFTDPDDFVTMAGRGPEWGEIRMLRTEFGDDGGAILYEGENRSDGLLVRTAEFYRVEEGRITEIEITWSPAGELG
ncbi:MAG: nuclear transport factor 2 family protein [Acidimicrobiia bacterium]|nr:nuclear transport factor 2 family protein [Acidimicrobiia bacterium]